MIIIIIIIIFIIIIEVMHLTYSLTNRQVFSWFKIYQTQPAQYWDLSKEIIFVDVDTFINYYPYDVIEITNSKVGIFDKLLQQTNSVYFFQILCFIEKQ